MTFTRNEVRETHSFFKRGDFKVSCLNLRVVGFLGEKFTFFKSVGITKISRNPRLSIYINVVLLINFSERFELCFYFKYSRTYIQELIKFYNLGDKTLVIFETFYCEISSKH